jgi:hypothetical protein
MSAMLMKMMPRILKDSGSAEIYECVKFPRKRKMI